MNSLTDYFPSRIDPDPLLRIFSIGTRQSVLPRVALRPLIAGIALRPLATNDLAGVGGAA